MDEKARFNTETHQTKENGIKGSERAYMDKYEEKDFKSAWKYSENLSLCGKIVVSLSF